MMKTGSIILLLKSVDLVSLQVSNFLSINPISTAFQKHALKGESHFSLKDPASNSNETRLFVLLIQMWIVSFLQLKMKFVLTSLLKKPAHQVRVVKRYLITAVLAC